MDDEVYEKVKKAGKISAKAREYGASLIREGEFVINVANSVEEYIREKGAEYNSDQTRGQRIA